MDFGAFGLTDEEFEAREREYELMPRIGEAGDGSTTILTMAEWQACRFAFSYLRTSLAGGEFEPEIQAMLTAARGAMAGDNDAFANGVLALSRTSLMTRDAAHEQMRHDVFTRCSQILSGVAEGMRSAETMFTVVDDTE